MKALRIGALVALLVLLMVSIVVSAHYGDWFANVSRIFKFNNISDLDSFKQYQLNTTSNTITSASSTYVSFTVDSGKALIKDLSTDNILPVFGMPYSDHIYVLKGLEGDVWVKVLDYNSTDGTYTELAGIHISPAADEVAIVPLTSKGLVIMYLGSTKFEFNVTGWNLIALIPASENSTVSIAEIVEAEVPPEVLDAPFSGTEVSGSDSRVIEITGSGTLRVWFWEAHQNSDIDFAIFYGTNSYYNRVENYVPVDTYDKYRWVTLYYDVLFCADTAPIEWTFDMNSIGGRIKIVTYPFLGDSDKLGPWRVVYSLTGGVTTSIPTYTPTTTPRSETPAYRFNVSNDTMKWLAIGGFAIFILGLGLTIGGRKSK